MKYTHESEKLNALLGKKVWITLLNGRTLIGTLTRPSWKDYSVVFFTGNEYLFRKTHVKKIEVVR